MVMDGISCGKGVGAALRGVEEATVASAWWWLGLRFVSFVGLVRRKMGHSWNNEFVLG